MTSAESDLETLARRLEASPHYRVLRALRRPERLAAVPEGARVGAFLDVETTGLDPVNDAVIEFALVRFAYRDDEVLGVLADLAAFEDPGRPIPPEITRLTGIDDAMVAGQVIDDAAVEALLEDTGLVIAHNAGFDRPFAERRFPRLADVAWACTLRDVPWRDAGYESSGLQALVMANGGFFDGHRAVEDCYAGLFLLGTQLPDERGSVLGTLRRSALRRDVRLWAVGSPFETKDALKARGYRWSGETRAWWCDVPEDAVGDEETWLRDHVYGGRAPRLPRRALDAYTRYSHRAGDTPD